MGSIKKIRLLTASDVVIKVLKMPISRSAGYGMFSSKKKNSIVDTRSISCHLNMTVGEHEYLRSVSCRGIIACDEGANSRCCLA